MGKCQGTPASRAMRHQRCWKSISATAADLSAYFSQSMNTGLPQREEGKVGWSSRRRESISTHPSYCIRERGSEGRGGGGGSFLQDARIHFKSVKSTGEKLGSIEHNQIVRASHLYQRLIVQTWFQYIYKLGTTFRFTGSRVRGDKNTVIFPTSQTADQLQMRWCWHLAVLQRSQSSRVHTGCYTGS